jgi:hypothetical protein
MECLDAATRLLTLPGLVWDLLGSGWLAVRATGIRGILRRSHDDNKHHSICFICFTRFASFICAIRGSGSARLVL